MRKAALFAGTAATVLTLALPALALETSATSSASAPRLAAVCKRMEGRIDERIGRFDENKARHVSAYNNLKDRIAKLVARMDEQGLDTAELKADLAALDVKIKKLAADYAAFVAQLRKTRSFACGKSEGAFKENMSGAGTLLKAVNADVKDIHEFYRSTIRPDIEALREQKQAQQRSATGTEEAE